MQCIGVSCKQGRYPCQSPGLCQDKPKAIQPSRFMKQVHESADFVTIFLQLRKNYPEQTRRKSLQIAFKACWPTPSK